MALSTYCLVAASNADVGFPYNISGVVNVPPVKPEGPTGP